MDITPIVQSIIGIAAAAVTAFVIPFIKNKTTAQQRASIMTTIRTAVTAAEQISNLITGTQKKSYVNKVLAGKGLNINSAEIDAMIESAVYEIKIGGASDALL